MFMKIKKNILVMFMITFLMFGMTSCFSSKTDDEIVEEKIQNLIQNLEENNKDGIKELFAKTKIDNIDNFDETIDQLLEYYDGTYESKKMALMENFVIKMVIFQQHGFCLLLM